MEITTLFTEQRWNILKLLSKDMLSPLQLAEKSNTTIANISQQLKLLEAASLVKKEKIKNREKGKPRTVFSLSHNYVYLVSTMNDFAEKKLLTLTDYHKAQLRILFLENSDIHYYIAKLYWELEPHLSDIRAIVYMPGTDEIRVAVISEKAKDLERKLNINSINRPNCETKVLKLLLYTKNDFLKAVKSGKNQFSSSNTIQFIHDPERMVSEIKNQKEVINA